MVGLEPIWVDCKNWEHILRGVRSQERGIYLMQTLASCVLLAILFREQEVKEKGEECKLTRCGFMCFCDQEV